MRKLFGQISTTTYSSRNKLLRQLECKSIMNTSSHQLNEHFEE